MACAIGDQPFFEGGLLDGEPLEELAAVERARLAQRFRGALLQQLLEGGDIDLHRRMP
jgi:hypothetical protein